MLIQFYCSNMFDEWWRWFRVRVANELGAGNGKGAKFATKVSVITSIVIGLFFWFLIMIFHNEIALLFSSSKPVLQAVNKLSLLLAFTILLNSVQPVLSGKHLILVWDWKSQYLNVFIQSTLYSILFPLIKEVIISWFLIFFNFLFFTGVAVGSGWQSYVAYINLGCYYLIGVPLGFLIGWGFHQGVMVSFIVVRMLEHL